jgi:penicillin-binding protein 2
MAGGSGDLPSGERFTRRVLLLGFAQAAGFAALGTRLYQLQVMEGGRFAPLAEDNRIDIKVLVPVRGRIFDRAGRELAHNNENYNATVRVVRDTDLPKILKLISEIITLPMNEQSALLVKAQKQARGTSLVIASDLSFDQVAAINLLAPQLPGVETNSTHRRGYEHGDVMGHIVGYVGRVERHALDDDPLMRLQTIKVGKSGAERGLEMSLRGRGGTRKFEVDSRGRVVRHLDETEPVNGTDAVLSVDLELQQKIVARLARERRAALVVLDVGSGEIVAMASTPSYNAATVAAGMDEAEWKLLSNADDQPLLNRAIGGIYPPGSTFKMVTALAALEAGTITPKEKCDCSGVFELAGQTYRCWKRQGHVTADLHKALRESCDLYFYEIAKRTGITAIAAMGRRLGLGQIYECGLPQQKRGVIPDPDWKRAEYRAGWLDGETILAGIGQGFVSTTPLQLAVMTARIATGRAVVPTIVRLEPGVSPVFEDLGLNPTWISLIRDGMIAVVNEDGGTGSEAQVSGGRVKVAGKTGTSQVRSTTRDDDDGVWEHRDHALFVSYFPATAPRYSIACVIEHGGGGGTAAAPVVRDVIEYILADDPASKPYPKIKVNAAQREPLTQQDGGEGHG